ncbi:MAG: hypothetical protein MJ132_06360, partial [Clostridia bacterium]|nr:hypothetical protein [Clostridia bacterium]
DNGETFDTGLYVTTMQLANSKTPFAVYGGTSKSSLAKLSTGVVQAHSDRFDDTLHYKYNIATQTKNLNRYYIQIRISAGSTDLLRAVKVYRPFTKQSGQLNGLTTTLKTARLQSLLVSKRAETENIYREYLKEHGKKDRIIGFADSLMKAGCYSTAHELLSGEISQVLPAKYLIKGSADLVRYPVSVQLANASDMVQMTLTEVSASGMSFRFDTEKAQSVTLKFNGLNNGKRYAVQSLGNNAFRLVETTGGTLRPTNGKLTHTVNVTLPQAATYQSISGRAYANASGSTITLTVQNPAISNYSLYEKYTAASSCVFTRHKDGSTTSSTTRPRAGDYVILTFNSNNQVTKCESVYGEKTATIKSFTPPSVTAGGNNGVVEFTDGTKFELENQAKTTDITYVDSTGEEQYTYARYCTAAQLTSIFKVGKTITVTYCPETYNGSMKRLLTAIIP